MSSCKILYIDAGVRAGWAGFAEPAGMPLVGLGLRGVLKGVCHLLLRVVISLLFICLINMHMLHVCIVGQFCFDAQSASGSFSSVTLIH